MRKIIAAAVFAFVALLFLDFTGALHLWLGWLAKIQIIPAIFAADMIVLVALAIFTLLFGRLYCSIICPLGIVQDGISNLSGKRKGRKNRFRYSKSNAWLRYGILALFLAGLITGTGVVVSLLDPYASFGRIASNLFAPLYRAGNNLLAWFAEKAGSYTFYSTEIWIKSWVTLAVSAITLLLIGLLAWKNGRTYCNTLCPVGTFLGFFSRFSLFRLTFDTGKCTKCGLCEKNCKSSCIDSKNWFIDRSRCVTCFNCVDKCKAGAIKYSLLKIDPNKAKPIGLVVPAKKEDQTDTSLRNFLSIAGLLTMTHALKAQQLHVDGGLAEIKDKKIPERKTPVLPPGAESLQNMKNHCTACQLCVSSCPNQVLRPSVKLSTFMQPEMSFERGYCRPECNECSQVCPNKAIRSVTTAEKTSISIGKAIWMKENCLVNKDQVKCTSCERHCPVNAISLIPLNPGDDKSLKIPIIQSALCIGCGACEHYCPARPFSAIYVEGNRRHHIV